MTLSELTGVVSAALAAIPLLWLAFQYIFQKRQEQKNLQFKTYHALVKQLVEREDKSRPMRLDRQLAVVFELRRFVEYYEPSLRILRGLRDSWAENGYGPEDKNKRLIEEMDVTIAWMESRIAEVHPVAPRIRSTLRRVASSLRVIYSEK